MKQVVKEGQGDLFGARAFVAAGGPRRPPRRTSAKAYEAVLADGTVGRQQREVYAKLYHDGPMTAGELNQALRKPGQVAPGYHKRLSELERMGLAYRVGTRDCPVTGREATLWDVTEAKPGERKSPVKQRTHTVLAVGSSPEDAIKTFASVIGWTVEECSVKVDGPNARWSANGKFDDESTFRAGGLTVPGGSVLTRWE